ncbi:(E)-4-hydroxy-3-methylbut-2-enyl-diphosphate synthase [Saccharicrinis sp. FJH54]|uniref:(E)-4-hydroxy-3-methylbut-2-enyl-diphosphate synthase n=1 Tax=Saccharicrinis sp. FJH54 TaxID=3344665 RepID=UPI0035D438E2
MSGNYINLTRYKRWETSEVEIGDLTIGGKAPIRIQSMTNTDTNDTETSVAQAIRIIEAGGELVRLTAQGTREAENLGTIKSALIARGYKTPVVADIHFNPRAALVAAEKVDKVRINPGNFVDPAKQFKSIDYTEQEYTEELANIRYKFLPFLALCQKNGTAIRIGVNHGSLSDRIMSRYGDTPEGMVESCMEYLRIANEVGFNNIVLSIKASNTRIMVHTVRLLVKTMEQEGMNYPLHLGVTEAGDAEDGRIKSAVGIGALLVDGIGDTIRVSLSEDPELEIPVAKTLVDYVTERAGHTTVEEFITSLYHPFIYSKIISDPVKQVGGENVPVVVGSVEQKGDFRPDLIFKESRLYSDNEEISFVELKDDFDKSDLVSLNEKTVLVLSTGNKNIHAALRSLRFRLLENGIKNPVVFKLSYAERDKETFMLKAATDAGILFLDGLGDGLWLEDENQSPETLVQTAFSILQASRDRMTKPDYISCPGCGRTLFDLQKTIARIKARTSHLKGLKIGIMGCIVNGPGEMADADYGYVGAGRGRISLYKGKTCIEKNIPEDDAVEKLISLIKENGDWVEELN